jgi:hypothetical protein
LTGKYLDPWSKVDLFRHFLSPGGEWWDSNPRPQDGELSQGILKGGSITVPLTSCLTGLDKSVLQIKTKIVSCHTADSKPVKQEVNGTVILPP